MELYDPQKDCWTTGPVMPAPCSFAAAAMLGGQVRSAGGRAGRRLRAAAPSGRHARLHWPSLTPPLPSCCLPPASPRPPHPPLPQTFVVEGAAHAPHVLRFDRRQRAWHPCTGLATPRVNMAVAACEDLLYCLVSLPAYCLA